MVMLVGISSQITTHLAK